MVGITSINPPKAVDFLKSRGYRLTTRANWLMPYKEYQPTDQEIAVIDYLCEVQDYGNLAGYLMPGNKAMEFSFIINMEGN